MLSPGRRSLPPRSCPADDMLYSERFPAGAGGRLSLGEEGAALVYVIGGIVGAAAVVWALVALAWASSVSRHTPELRESIRQIRYGWKCPKCGRIHAPICKVNKCGGPLVWVQRGASIKCSRCHRRFIPHPFLFKLTPRPRRMWCSSCKSIGLITDWKLS